MIRSNASSLTSADDRAALVEKIAREMSDHDTAMNGPRSYPWEKLHESTRQWWRGKATAALAAYEAHMAEPTHKHWKGGKYRVIGSAKIEADLSPVIVYQGHDGTMWVRPEDEFNERFVPLAAATAQKEPQT